MLARDHNHDGELGPNSAGQSGDLQGISDVANADSESVQELLQEEHSFEGEAIKGMESAKNPDVAEVTTREIPEDGVPEEVSECQLTRTKQLVPSIATWDCSLHLYRWSGRNFPEPWFM